MEPYRSMPRYRDLSLPATDAASSRVLCLPTGTAVDIDAIEVVCDVVESAVRHAAEISRRDRDGSTGQPSSPNMSEVHSRATTIGACRNWFMPTTSQTFDYDYDSAAEGSPAVREIRELVRYRDLVVLLVARLIKNRYKRSVLGVLWTLLNPLLNMAVLAIMFSSIFQTNVPHYPVCLLSALIAWTFFSQTTTYSAASFLGGGSLLKRIYLPPIRVYRRGRAQRVGQPGHQRRSLVLIMIAVGHPLHVTWWFVPAAALLLATFALGVALVVSVAGANG